MKEYKYLSHIAIHPLDGYEDYVYYKAGSLLISFGILGLWFVAKIIEHQAVGFTINTNDPENLNILFIFAQTIFVFTLWCVSNWAFCTLSDGKGTFKNIWISCSYALTPMVIATLLSTLLSNVMIVDESIFYVTIKALGNGWSIVLLICAIRTIHDFSFGKTFLSIGLTLFGIAFILFLLILSFSLYKQVFDLFKVIVQEIMFRI